MKNDMIATKPLIIERTTRRLFIRSYNGDDYEDSLFLYSDPELTHFFDHGKPRTISEIKNYLAERGSHFFEAGCPFGIFSVFLKDDLTFIGQIDALPTEIPGEIEIGWIFKKEFQNQGYCTEAVNTFLIPLIKEVAFDGVEASGSKINRIVATAHPNNIASQKIMMKSGLSFYKKGLRYGGNPRNWYELNLENLNNE